MMRKCDWFARAGLPQGLLVVLLNEEPERVVSVAKRKVGFSEAKLQEATAWCALDCARYPPRDHVERPHFCRRAGSLMRAHRPATLIFIFHSSKRVSGSSTRT